MSEALAYVSPRRLDATETAKLVRAALRREFPGVKFSVRTDKYAGGASVNVTWTDGPTSKAVDRVAGIYSGADFDGMVDLKTYAQHWLNPDGTVTIAHAGGQGSTRPEYIGDPPSPGAELVRMGADFVHSQRTISDGWRAEIFRHFADTIGRPIGDPAEWGVWRTAVPLAVDRLTGDLLHMVETDTEDLSVVFHQFTGCRARYGSVTFRCDPDTGATRWEAPEN